MNKLNHTYRLISLTLALLVFTSSVGLTIDLHYCKGELKSMAFIGKAKSCHDLSLTTTKKTCPHHQKLSASSIDNSSNKKNCCENKTKRFQAEDDRNISFSNLDISISNNDYVKVFVNLTLLENALINNDNVTVVHYKPPVISRDISVLFESFLI